MSSSPHPDPASIRRLEFQTTDELEKIPGVLRAAVWIQGDREIGEAHISCAPGIAPASLRHAIGELFDRLGLDMAPGNLHIQVQDPSTSSAPLWQSRSLVLEGIEVRRADQLVTCCVRLRRRGTTVAGEATDLDTELGRARAATRATLQAAEELIRAIRLGIEGVQILELFGRRYVALSIEALFSRRFTQLPGIAPIDRSAEDAACFATLGAIERWLSW